MCMAEQTRPTKTLLTCVPVLLRGLPLPFYHKDNNKILFHRQPLLGDYRQGKEPKKGVVHPDLSKRSKQHDWKVKQDPAEAMS